MWILFGIEHNGESFVYFIGIFDDLKLANKERLKFITNSKDCSSDDFFIKPVEMNIVHTYDFSWEKSRQIINNNRTLADLKWEVLKKFHKRYNL